MKLFLVTQRIFFQNGPLLGEAKLIGVVIAKNEATALAAIPRSALLGPEWFAYDPEVKVVGEFHGSTRFLKASL